MDSTPQTFRRMGWGEGLSLPTLVDPAITASVLQTAKEWRRITQLFQSRHLAAVKQPATKWFVLQRPKCRSRTGLLIVVREGGANGCYFVAPEMRQKDGSVKPPRIALLRLRVDPGFFAPGVGATVFAATLSPTHMTLSLEDVLVWKGRALCGGGGQPFRQRILLAEQWLIHSCTPDPKLIGGLRMEVAAWKPLASLLDCPEEGVWELICDTVPASSPVPLRLLWIPSAAPAAPAAAAAPPPSVTEPTPTAESVAFATKDPGGPELWTLTAPDGTGLGRALIRKLAVSSVLFSAATTTNLPVRIEWNDVFKKWEILGLAKSL